MYRFDLLRLRSKILSFMKSMYGGMWFHVKYYNCSLIFFMFHPFHQLQTFFPILHVIFLASANFCSYSSKIRLASSSFSAIFLFNSILLELLVSDEAELILLELSKIEFPAKFIREVVKGVVVVAVLLTAVEAAGIIAIVFFGWF